MPAFNTNAGPIPNIAALPMRRRQHDVEWIDEFAWLRADNWQEVLRAPETLPKPIRAVLEEENAYADRVLAPLERLRATLVKEMRGRIKEEDSDPPQHDGPFQYYRRTREGGQHELHCRRPREGGAETLMLDGDALAKDKDFFDIGDAAHSPDHRWLAWSCDDKGSELHDIRIRSIESGEDLSDLIADSDGDMVWSAASDAIYYVGVDANHRPSRVLRHRLGTAASTDKLIYEEIDPGLFVSLQRLQAGRFASIQIHDHDLSECRLIDLHDPAAAPRLIERRVAGMRYEVENRGDILYLLTNADGAKDFKIVAAPLERPGRAHWRDLVAHVPGRMIVGLMAFQDFIVRSEREHGLPRIVITHVASEASHAIAFDEEAYALSVDPGLEFQTDMLRFTYSSMTTPHETYDYDMRSAARRLIKREEVPSGHDPKAYVTRRIFATAPDGARVPISLLHRADSDPAAPAPLLLYGYGAYGHALSASFQTNRLSLVDRGFVYAIAHVRGGTDQGWDWYENGKLAHKRNTFGDFLAAARHLIALGFTARGRIVAHGGSAGGMLMGVAANEGPELFAGIIADVPFVDVLATMLDDALPLTPPEWQEWGNPIESAQVFENIRGYSPYDNVRAQNYPAIFIQGGLTDPRVTYWEPAKWAARLRARMTGGGPILLKTVMEAGHGGAPGRLDQLDEVAQHYAFALACVESECA